MQAYIGVRAGDNVNEWADLPGEQLKIIMPTTPNLYIWKRVPHTKWCVLRYPNPSLAQLANMSIEGFEDFYFNVCNLDYSKMSKAMELWELMERTDRVRIMARYRPVFFHQRDVGY